MNKNKMITIAAAFLVLFMGFQLLGPGYTGDPELNLPERIRTVFQHIVDPFIDDDKDQQQVADNQDHDGQPIRLEDENGEQLEVPLDPVNPQDQVALPENTPAQQQPDNRVELPQDNGAEIPPDNLVDLPPEDQVVPMPDNQGDNQFPIDFFNFN